MGQPNSKCSSTGLFVPFAWLSTYVVRVKTGDRKGAGTDADVAIRLFDEDGESSELMNLDVSMRDDFERGHLDDFNIRDNDLALGPLIKIEIRRNNRGKNADWFVDFIDVEDKRTKVTYVFPVHRWVESEKPLFVQQFDAVLPQLDKHREQRDAELVAKRKVYEYGRKAPGLPILVKALPKDEQFSDDYKYDMAQFMSDLKGSMLILKLLSGAGTFKSIKELEQLYGRLKFVDRPTCMEHWREDVWFGAQRVMNCNAVVIQLCTIIPENFGVTSELVEPFLEGKSLSDALKEKKIYKTDLKVLEGIEGAHGLKVCQPLALFYVNKAGDLLPIAIQLFQGKGPDNPVFLPSDNPNLWLLVKMWYNMAESNQHQSLTHLAFTHMKAEGIALCTHRNLSPSHPVFRLLAPHFLHLMAINDRAINHLLAPGGPIDKLIAIGSDGFFKLVSERQGDFRLNQEGHLLNDLKARGVDDTEALPFYPYRDDAIPTWNALLKYVTGILAIYYEDEQQIREDTELQQWAKELTASYEEGGIGMSGVPGNGKFETMEELIEAVTCIIFMCSVRHGAANFSQYDDYAFTPNYATHLNGDPPSTKEPKTENDLLKALPLKDKTLGIIAVAKHLSNKGTNSLGDFEITYLFDQRAQAVASRLRVELVKHSKTVAERNKTRKYKYDYLDPNFIPNSISI